MTPINVEDPIHEQFRQSSALGEMERYIVSNYVYCSLLYYSVTCSFSLSYNIKAVVFIVFNVNVLFYPTLTNNDCCLPKADVVILTFCFTYTSDRV